MRRDWLDWFCLMVATSLFVTSLALAFAPDRQPREKKKPKLDDEIAGLWHGHHHGKETHHVTIEKTASKDWHRSSWVNPDGGRVEYAGWITKKGSDWHEEYDQRAFLFHSEPWTWVIDGAKLSGAGEWELRK